MNQVVIVSTHVYHPLLNSNNTVSAQVVWRDTADASESYDVRVRTADAELMNITVSANKLVK